MDGRPGMDGQHLQQHEIALCASRLHFLQPFRRTLSGDDPITLSLDARCPGMMDPGAEQLGLVRRIVHFPEKSSHAYERMSQHFA